MKRLSMIGDSYYGYWRDYLDLPTSANQDAACLFLESRGQKFLVDFGYENALSKAEEYKEWRKLNGRMR